MPTFRGTARDDSWTIVNPGIFTLDGLGGVDTILWGTSRLSDYQMYLGPIGELRLDSISGASATLNATLYNIERMVFDSGREVVDLRVAFPTAVGQLIDGTASNDVLSSTSQNDGINGAAGIDTVVFRSASTNFTIANTTKFGPPTHTVRDKTGVDGADTLQNIERLKFSDLKLALDVGTTQSAGQTALLLGAVLPGKLYLDASKQTLLGAVIDLFDQGLTLQQLSGALMRLPIWDALTGKPVPTNADIANYLLTNVNEVAPNAATLQSAATALGAQTGAAQGDFLAQLAASQANQVHVGLVGLAATGLLFG